MTAGPESRASGVDAEAAPPTPAWARQVATALGAGRSPVAPGTMGALCAMPVVVILAETGFWIRLAVVSTVTVVGTIAAGKFARGAGQKDPSAVVIDEFAGIMVTFLAVPITAFTAILGFSLFRLFDIWKPPPVNWLDRHVEGGVGIMADDLAAGLMALLLLRGILLLC